MFVAVGSKYGFTIYTDTMGKHIVNFLEAIFNRSTSDTCVWIVFSW